MEWQRLSAREANLPQDVLVNGVPDYLKHPLTEWLRTEFGWHRTSSQGGVDQELLQTLALAVRIPVERSHEIGGISNQITAEISANEQLFLDTLDATLYLRNSRAQSRRLRQILELGSSAWTVNNTGTGLVRRVEPAAQEAYASASASADTVSVELNEAWASAFGRTPDPSDAWDHAIKAVEELLIPLVLPGVAKPNLGGVAGQLRSAPYKWRLIPSTSSTTLSDALTLEAMLRMIWPNPDRHGGSSERRTPTQGEAERVVHLAVTVVQLCRDGGLSGVRTERGGLSSYRP
jgi:hypothetical protein